MIVIVGSPVARPVGDGIAAAGLGASIARVAAAAGAAVEVVGRVGEDAAGDALLLAMAASGVGHVAVLREPGRPTPTAAPELGGSVSPDGPALGEAILDEDALRAEGAALAGADDIPLPDGLSVDEDDLELALRYVPDYRVLIVAADLDPAALAAVVAAVGWSGAHLIALLPDGASTASIPDAATVLVRPATDPDGTFASIVAAYAVALDRGNAPADAFASAQASGGWAAVTH